MSSSKPTQQVLLASQLEGLAAKAMQWATELREVARTVRAMDGHELPEMPPLLADVMLGESAFPAGMMKVWKAAPLISRNRSSRLKVDKVWKRMKLESHTAQILESLEAYCECYEWTKQGGQFIPGLDLWLKNYKFEEQPPPTAEEIMMGGAA